MTGQDRVGRPVGPPIARGGTLFAHLDSPIALTFLADCPTWPPPNGSVRPDDQVMPRVVRVHLAQLLAEIGPILDRAATLDQACAETGVTPVTKASAMRILARSWMRVLARCEQDTTYDPDRHAATRANPPLAA